MAMRTPSFISPKNRVALAVCKLQDEKPPFIQGQRYEPGEVGCFENRHDFYHNQAWEQCVQSYAGKTPRSKQVT